MPSDSYRELKELFGQAVELEPEARSAFLEATCGQDLDMRQQLEALLEHDERADSFLERPAPAAAEALLSPAEALQVGDMVDHFRVMRLLGRGGMGQVFLARDTKLGRKVALKMIHPGLLGTAKAEQSFLTEARTTARFSHPNIVAIHAVGEHRSVPYVALEYLEGETLAERCAERALSLPEVMRIGLALAKALREAHRHGVLHRDLKPDNVVIARDGRLRVLDFGLARRWREPERRTHDSTTAIGDSVPPPSLGPDLGEDSRPRALAGTPRYMAPEQWMLGEFTGATDIWALGVILYELVAGERMFPLATPPDTGDLASFIERTAPAVRPKQAAPDATELAHQGQHVCSADPCPRVDDCADVPIELADLIAQCLDKDPTARPSAAAVVDGLNEVLAAPRLSLVGEDSPFRGLLAFNERHADLFFGREGEVVALLEKLRARPLLPIIGPSGAGKSSLVLAGLLPRLHEQEAWTVLHVRPGNRPFFSLAIALQRWDSTRGSGASGPDGPGDERDEAERVDPASLAEQLQSSPLLLSVKLRALAEADNAKVMLVVDQLEELLTMVDDAELRATYLEAVCSAADDPQDPVRVVLTARDDFLGQLAMGAEVADALAQVVVIQRLERAALVEILTRPLELVGYAYEDPELVDEMVDAVREESACLPLLQFAAQLLWEQRDRTNRLLTRATYEAMGGVEGAIASHANGVLDGFTPEEHAQARELCLRLVGDHKTRRLVERQRALDGLGERAESVLRRLTNARLISVSKSRGGSSNQDALLELAHESLTSRWSTLARWLDESEEEQSFFLEIGQAAELWDKRGRRPAELWQGDALDEALRFLKRASMVPPQVVSDFVVTGGQGRSASRRRRQGLVVAALVALSVVALVLAYQRQQAVVQRGFAEEGRREAERQRRDAVHSRAESLRESARAALGSGHPLEARAKLRLAFEIEDHSDCRALWWLLSREPMLWWEEQRAPVHAVAFSTNGRQIMTASDDGVHVLDALTRRGSLLRGGRTRVLALARSPDGRRLLGGTAQGQLLVWDLQRGELMHTLTGHRGEVWAVAFAPRGERVASAGMDGSVRVWDLSNGRQEVNIAAHDSGAHDVVFSPHGRLLVSGGLDQTVRLWTARNGEPQGVLEGHDGGVVKVVVSAAGKLAASAGRDGQVIL